MIDLGHGSRHHPERTSVCGVRIDAAWVGTANDLAVRASVYVHCKRSASVVEKLLATGTGSDVAPAMMGFEGPISYQDVGEARRS